MNKSVTNTLAIILVPIAVIFIWAFARLVIGNSIGAKEAHEDLVAHTVARAFTKYSELHNDLYPKFQNSDDIAKTLAPLLVKEANTLDDEGRHRTTYQELDSAARKAVWNLSLSQTVEPSPLSPSHRWAFYLEHSPHRFNVCFTDGKRTIERDRQHLQDLIR